MSYGKFFKKYFLMGFSMGALGAVGSLGKRYGQDLGPPPDIKITLPDSDIKETDLNWDKYRHRWEQSEDGTYYGLKFVYYCKKILRPQYQYMNIYVPAAYLNGDGTVNFTGACGGFTAKTAPIILYNTCAGWASSIPGDVKPQFVGEGFVHVEVGARSRDAGDAGKAPSAVVDQKAAVRMLRLNDEFIPGDKDRIISCGGSGGGQMSSIIGATGNMESYYPDLAAIGAAGIEVSETGFKSTIRDDIFASQCYFPIADLNNADLAYAWFRFDTGETGFTDMMGGRTEFSPFQLELQRDMASAFCDYVNSLGLKNPDGMPISFESDESGKIDPRCGTYYDQILQNISDALNRYIAAYTAPDGSIEITYMDGMRPVTEKFDTVDHYLESYPDWEKWLRINGDKTCSVTDLAAFLNSTGLKRNKNIPGFDVFDFTPRQLSGENDAFGTPEEASVHFAASTAHVLKKNYEKYRAMEGFDAEAVDAYIAQGQRNDLARQTYLMNATHIMLNAAHGREKTDLAPHWRIRSGTADEHTSFSVGYNLALAAKMAGAQANYALVWSMPHAEQEGISTGTMADWVREICK